MLRSALVLFGLVLLSYLPLAVVISMWRAAAPRDAYRRTRHSSNRWFESLMAGRRCGALACAFPGIVMLVSAYGGRLFKRMGEAGSFVHVTIGATSPVFGAAAIYFYLRWARGRERWVSPLAVAAASTLSVLIALAGA